jgi:hypothetical protein
MKSGTTIHKPRLDCSGIVTPVTETLEKHKRYGDSYGKNEVYWGLGIECESYLEMSKPVLVKAGFMINNHSRERYSVDYYNSYKKEPFTKAFSKFQNVNEVIPLPLLVNSHALTKLDSSFEHQTLYVKGTPPNPKFNGKTIYQELVELQPSYFKENYETTFTFDGDSIEIMTQDFYKGTVEKVVRELSESRQTFIKNIKETFESHSVLNKYTDIKWTSGNHGFAVMATNPNNLAIFNNGTYHINITLPSLLSEKGTIDKWPIFEDNHRQFIRYIQWMEPLLVANFGSPDPMAWLVDGPYAVGTQRGAMSRYIGLGTYDTDKMKKGKCMSVDLSDVKSTWYKEYHATSGYIALDKVGLDINFNKHWNHGVELRFFDWFPEERLPGLLKFLIYLGDLALTAPCKEDPLTNPFWNKWMVRAVKKGREAKCTKEEAMVLTRVLGFPCKPCENLETLFADIYSKLSKQFSKNKGPCSKYFLREEGGKAAAVASRPESPSAGTKWTCCCV